LVLFVMLVRLFSAQRDRDHYFLAVLSFLMVLSAAVLTVDSTFLFALAGFILTAVAAFMLMEMMHSLQKAPVLAGDSHLREPHRQLSFAIATIAPVLLLLILCGGAIIFFFLPRISAGFMNAQSGSNEISTGFSDRVELGRIGEIQQSRLVVMHVRIDGDSFGGFSPKLRGVALNAFDGHNWSNDSPRRAIPRSGDGRFELRFGKPPAVRRIHYRVTMEPMLTDVFFLLTTPESLQGNYRAVTEDVDGDVFDNDAERPVGSYEADSDVPSPVPLKLAVTPNYAREFRERYLRLPPLDPRIRTLADQITASAPTPYARAGAIEAYLRSHYRYTLQLPTGTQPDPIAYFLFTRRQGHCEYFASSMAIMLRTVGIPSRVVNGFSGGEFNDITSQYVIRASDAHSWVEAYIPGQGWVTFDPTPAGAGETHSAWDRVMLYMDALSSFWREWVVNYDLSHQLRLSQDASRGSRAAVGRAQFWMRHQYRRLLRWARDAENRIAASTVRWGTRAIIVVAVLLFLFTLPRLLIFLRKVRLARRPRQSPQLAASIWYERMVRQTAKQGWKKSPEQTPDEFASLISDPVIKDRVVDFTEHYERARFGKSAEDASELPELYEEIKSAR
jgi:transglutaminase-like putative cysteine protease